jgi:hypothetical protein
VGGGEDLAGRDDIGAGVARGVLDAGADAGLGGEVDHACGAEPLRGDGEGVGLGDVGFA